MKKLLLLILIYSVGCSTKNERANEKKVDISQSITQNADTFSQKKQENAYMPYNDSQDKDSSALQVFSDNSSKVQKNTTKTTKNANVVDINANSEKKQPKTRPSLNKYVPHNDSQDKDSSALQVFSGNSSNVKKNTTKTTKNANVVGMNANAEKNYLTLRPFLDKYVPNKFIAKIDPNYTQAVIGKNGITCIFPVGVFDTSDSVSIEMTEYIENSAFLLAGFGTVSHGDMLQTAGTAFIKATVNGKDIEPKKEYFIAFPNKGNEEDGMQIFEGQMLPNGQINWNLQAQLQLNLQEALEKIGEVPSFEEATPFYHLTEIYEANSKTNSLANFRKKYPFGHKSEHIFSKHAGQVANNILMDSKSKNEMLWSILNTLELVSDKNSNFKTYSHGNIDAYNLSSIDTILSYYQKKDTFIIPESRLIFEISTSDTFPYPYREVVSTDILERRLYKSYVYSNKRFGWINCDKFINSKANKIDFAVNVPNNLKAASVQLYFPDLKSFLPLTLSQKNTWLAQRVPENQTAKIVVFALDHENKELMTIQDFKIKKETVSVNKLVSFSKEELIELLDKKR